MTVLLECLTVLSSSIDLLIQLMTLLERNFGEATSPFFKIGTSL